MALKKRQCIAEWFCNLKKPLIRVSVCSSKKGCLRFSGRITKLKKKKKFIYETLFSFSVSCIFSFVLFLCFLLHVGLCDVDCVLKLHIFNKLFLIQMWLDRNDVSSSHKVNFSSWLIKNLSCFILTSRCC